MLRLLADADVAGYVTTPGGASRRPGGHCVQRLWVNSLRYHRAEDVLMAYLHKWSVRG
jgi:hypothetical protein